MQKKQNKSKKSQKSGRTIDRARSVGRTLLLPVLLVVSSVAVVYSAVLVSRLTESVSYEEPLAANIVRLQVINASDNVGLMKSICRRINNFSNDRLEIHVVDSSRFRRSPADNSIVISRQEDMSAAREFCALMGLHSDELTYKPLEFNHELANVTLIIGNDFDMDNFNNNFSEKEK